MRVGWRLAASAQRAITGSGKRVGAVIVYHAVGPVAGDPERDLIPVLSSHVFRKQLGHLRDAYDVVSLKELPTRVARRAAGDRVPVALTFDDDLSGHLSHAAPALSDHQMPATFFLTGRTLAGPDPFWWQDLQIVARDRDLEVVTAHLGREHPWARQTSSLHDLAKTIEDLSPAERDSVAVALRDLADGVQLDKGLSAADLTTLLDQGFDLGFHTKRHDALPALGDAELAEAMHAGRSRLEAIHGKPLDLIAYPHGRADRRVSDAAAASGFTTGVTWTERAVSRDQIRLLLDRVNGWAPSVEVFMWRLARAVGRAS